ncbi:hypothetical protein HG826_01615 [Streptomyces sp. GMY01]|uniref:hypothetical protein n=1 Tax=Streptomyces sp. GMY02 TaxID=1333528 RepID=UPI00146EC22E|nr:hypothetical protein [Streptomyces sp. GMY02]NMO32308.1 hypothetical protein [Streptomyces sp. GMY02]
MKRRRTALLATVVVAASALPTSATALADTRSVHSPSALGAKATRHGGRSESAGSLLTRLKDVPATFEAGGDWREFDLALSNVSDGPISKFTVDVQVITITPDPALHPSHMRAQMMLDGSWTDVEPADMGPRDANLSLPLHGVVLPPGTTVFRMRMKFSSDAPRVEFFLGAQPDEDNATGDVDYWESAQLVPPTAPEPSPDPDPSADPGPGPSPDPEPSADPDPSPSEGPTPSPNPSTGSGAAGGNGGATGAGGSAGAGNGSGSGAGSDTGTGIGSSAGDGGDIDPASMGADGASDPGGVLARTGGNAVTRWALGVGGVLVILGAALAAAGQRRRKRQTTMARARTSSGT